MLLQMFGQHANGKAVRVTSHPFSEVRLVHFLAAM